MLKLCATVVPREASVSVQARWKTKTNNNHNNNKVETVATQAIAVAKGGKRLRRDKAVFDFPPIG